MGPGFRRGDDFLREHHSSVFKAVNLYEAIYRTEGDISPRSILEVTSQTSQIIR